MNILCICSKGRNRSKYLARYLRTKGYSTRYGGIEVIKKDHPDSKPFTQEDVNWARIIIVVRKRMETKLKKKFKIKKQRIITLNVSDSQNIISKKHPEFKNMNDEEFNNRWTRPKLREGIKNKL